MKSLIENAELLVFRNTVQYQFIQFLELLAGTLLFSYLAVYYPSNNLQLIYGWRRIHAQRATRDLITLVQSLTLAKAPNRFHPRLYHISGFE
jgi:hypothetical protein